jgi:tRNA (guanine37-N1)-methyltransferase
LPKACSTARTTRGPSSTRGHHAEIRRWRLKQALGRTWLRRPELLQARGMSDEEKKLLAEFQNEYTNMSRS